MVPVEKEPTGTTKACKGRWFNLQLSVEELSLEGDFK